MNKSIKYQQMYEMRKLNKSYKEIGEKFKMSHQGAQFLLKKYFPIIKTIVPHPKFVKSICKKCNKEFTHNKILKPIFCSMSCRRIYQNENKKCHTPEEQRTLNRERMRKLYKTRKGKLLITKANLKQNKKFKNKTRVRQILNYHLRMGHIVKPDNCSMCGKVARLHGHHDDYFKPLEVKWVCSPCHYFIHHGYNLTSSQSGI